MGNSVKKIPWRKVYTFFKSPWVNNEPSKAKENVNKCHSKKALQRAKIRKKCDIKVWLWTLFGGRGIDVDEEKIMWIDNILIICNFIELFSNFFSLIWDIKKVAAYTYTRKGLLNSAFFLFFLLPFPSISERAWSIKKVCPLFPSNFWVTPFLLYFCWTLCSKNMKLFSNYQNSKKIQINYFDNTYILCSNVNRADISSKL